MIIDWLKMIVKDKLATLSWKAKGIATCLSQKMAHPSIYLTGSIDFDPFSLLVNSSPLFQQKQSTLEIGLRNVMLVQSELFPFWLRNIHRPSVKLKSSPSPLFVIILSAKSKWSNGHCSMYYTLPTNLLSPDQIQSSLRKPPLPIATWNRLRVKCDTFLT